MTLVYTHPVIAALALVAVAYTAGAAAILWGRS